MATRKIKDARDLSTNELIYFKGHAKATYMSDGSTVEDAINQIGTGEGTQGPQGPQGEQGPKGEDGATFTPSVDTDGNLSWTNDKGLSNPPTVNIKGPKGDSGEGGGGSSYAGNYPKVQIDSFGGVSLSPNTFYYQKYENVGTVRVTLAAASNTSIVNEYVLAFYVADNASMLSLPSSIVWANEDVPKIEYGYTYVVSIVDDIAVYLKAKGNKIGAVEYER